MEQYREQRDPREVVLTWRGQPEEVVLRREAPLPAGFSPRPIPPAPPPPPAAPARRRRRRWPWVVGGLAAAVLIIGLGIAAAYSLAALLDGLQRAPSIDDGRGDGGYYGDYWMEEPGDQGTDLPTYPLGGDFRLEYTEDHGPVLSAREVYEQVNPSVVAVVTYMGAGGATGTGVIMSGDGYVLTNYHVIEGGEECYILLSDGAYYPAELVAGDYEKDLAVLKADARDLPAAEFGDSDSLVVGDPVYAIGNPLGLELRGTLTDGIVSAINRDVDVDGITMTLIQTNAALNSGNSGGPLINQYGQVVGINTIKMVTDDENDSVEGLGFAIPISSASYVVNSLVQYGEVRPEPELGVMVKLRLTMLTDSLGGLEVDSVTPGMGADLAGIQAGDYIVAVDGEPVSTTNDIYRARRRYEEGESLPMTIWRDGTTLEVEVPLMVAD